jgi:hypothetical protein
MDDFPKFMKHPANRIARSGQPTPGVEGYIFDGADGSQMAFWACRETAVSAAHAHDYDELNHFTTVCCPRLQLPVGGMRENTIASGDSED